MRRLTRKMKPIGALSVLFAIVIALIMYRLIVETELAKSIIHFGSRLRVPLERLLNIPDTPKFTAEEEINISKCTQNDSLFNISLRSPISDRMSSYSYLNSDSVVLSIGGHPGETEAMIVNAYDSWMYIFEPMPSYARKLKRIFANNSKVYVLNIGLSKTDVNVKFASLGRNGERSSRFASENKKNLRGQRKQLVKLRSVNYVFKTAGFGSSVVDLLNIDCEGCEFEVLDELMRKGWTRNVRYLSVVSHFELPENTLKNPIFHYCRIRQLLHRTYAHVYFSAKNGSCRDNWKLKDVPVLDNRRIDMIKLIQFIEEQ